MEPQDQLSSQESAESAAPSAGDSHGRALQLSIVGVVLVLLFAVLVGFFTDFSLFRLDRLADEGQQDAGDAVDEQLPELAISQPTAETLHGGAIIDLMVTYDGQDVTQESFWYSDDSSIAQVANIEPIKGRVTPRDVGTTTVRAVYKELFAESQVVVKAVGLEVDCSLMPETGRVGEVIELVPYYVQGGAPHYLYSWLGDGGLDSNDPVVSIVYDTPGTKQIQFKTQDRAGAIAEMECEILITQ